MGLRAKLVTLLDRTRVLDLAVRAERVVPLPFLRMPGYHRIGDPKVIAKETDEGVVDATAEDFAQHVAFLVRHYEVVGIDRLRGYFEEGEPLPERAALITFDDGYRECLDVAFPILERHGVPGVFFVSSDHVTRRRAFWWDRIAYLFKRTQKARAELTYPRRVVLDVEHARDRAMDDALSIVKRTFGLDLDRYLDELAHALDVTWTDAEERRIADATILGWDELRAMHRAGMAIESHTHTHRVLQTLSEEELRHELAESKRTIEAELGAKVCAVAYPSGVAVGQRTPIGRLVREAGYTMGFSGNGVCRLGPRLDPLDLRRISVDLGIPEATYRARVVMPYARV